MKRKIFWFFSLVFVVLFGFNNAYAEDGVQYTEDGVPLVKVNLFIEGSGYEIGSAEVNASTVLEAIDVYAAINRRVEIVVERSNTEQRVVSIGGVANGTLGEDTGWYGAVVRDGNIIRIGSSLNMGVEEDDDIYIYYGRPDTVILPGIICEVTDNLAVFTIVKTWTLWEEADGKWQSTITEEYISNVRIHIAMPNGMSKILVTNELGQAVLRLNTEGEYLYYAEGYVQSGVPTIVKTKDESFVWGMVQGG